MLQAVAGYTTTSDDASARTSGDAGADISEGGKGPAGAAGAGQRRGVSEVEARVLGSLEAMLLEKNRHLEHEVTMARLQLAELTGGTAVHCCRCCSAHVHCSACCCLPNMLLSSSLRVAWYLVARCPGVRVHLVRPLATNWPCT